MCLCILGSKNIHITEKTFYQLSDSANYPWCSLLAWFWDQLQTKFNCASIYEWYQSSSAHAWDIFEQKNISYVPAVHFDCLDIRDGGSIKRTCNCTYWRNCKIWFSFIAARNNFFWCVEQLLAAWGAREMEPDGLFYGEQHANDCKQMQQEPIVLERSARLILDPGRDD